MVILGGLELVIGGVLIHHYRKKSKRQRRRRTQQDAYSDDELDSDYDDRGTHLRRHNSYPGPHRNPQPQPLPLPLPLPPQQKHTYAYRGPPQSLLQQRIHQRVQTQQQCPRRRPVPRPGPGQGPGPQSQYTPPVEPLRRQDSFATMQDVPVANGPRYTGDSAPTQTPPRTQTQSSGRRRPGQSVYGNGNAGFSQSVPAFEASTVPMPRAGVSELSAGRERWRADGQGRREGVAPAPLAITGTTRYEEDDDPPPPYEP